MDSRNRFSIFRHSGISLPALLVGVIVLLVGGVMVSDMLTCEGNCATVTCTALSPCAFDFDGDGTNEECTVGSMCAAGVAGTVCEDNWWPADDCMCYNVSRTPGQCAAACAKPN